MCSQVGKEQMNLSVKQLSISSAYLLFEIPFGCLFLSFLLSTPLRCEIPLPFGKALFLSWSKVTDVLITRIPAGYCAVCHCWIPPTACGTPFPAENIPDVSPSPGLEAQDK